MHKFTLSIFVILFLSHIATAQIGIGTNNPDPSAALDISSSDKGLLPPRVALVTTISPAPVTNPATGLLVYNTATSGSTPSNVAPGYYYWNGVNWYPVINKGNAYGEMQYWDGSKWLLITLGLNGQVLTICNGKPQWGPCVNTLTTAPANNPYEGYLNNLAPNIFDQGTASVLMQAWTNNGSAYYIRQCLKFDFGSIPAGAIIDSAKLYLYADSFPINGNQVDAMFGSGNVCTIQRITSNWTLPTPFSWNNPPLVTTMNQAILPQSNSAFENSVVNVTQLVTDMLNFGNNGFFIRLQTEQIYNSRQYVNSQNANAARRPKLVISYH